MRAEPSLSLSPGLPSARAELATPVISGGRLLAVIILQSNRPNAFSTLDEQQIVTLSGPLAVALANSNLFQGEQLRRQLAERLPLDIAYTDRKLCTDNGAMIATLGCYKAMLGAETADRLVPPSSQP